MTDPTITDPAIMEPVSQTDEDFDPIAPELAREAIAAAIDERLGPNWADEDIGWSITYDSDYLVRLTRGKTNLDFHCDLLGEITVEEREISPVQASGRLIAWAVLIATLFVVFAIAQLAGVFN
ncbi:MAG: hypothetical protein KC615_24355 [Anaerolineae bacterium]|nr:hypothetical protein [Anaerolineae bacterium]